MRFKNLLFSLFILCLLWTSCTIPHTVLTSNRLSADVHTLKIARPLVILDVIGSNENKDTSTQVSIDVENKIMDAVEELLPENIKYSYLVLNDSTMSTVDSSLTVLKNKVLISGDWEIDIPQPLMEVMKRDSIPFLLWVHVDGYEMTRKTYKLEKTGSIVLGVLGAFLGGDIAETPSRGDARLVGFIVDRDENNVAFFKIINIQNKYISETDNVHKAIIDLFDGYFYKYKKGQFEKVRH